MKMLFIPRVVVEVKQKKLMLHTVHTQGFSTYRNTNNPLQLVLLHYHTNVDPVKQFKGLDFIIKVFVCQYSEFQYFELKLLTDRKTFNSAS